MPVPKWFSKGTNTLKTFIHKAFRKSEGFWHTIVPKMGNTDTHDMKDV